MLAPIVGGASSYGVEAPPKKLRTPKEHRVSGKEAEESNDTKTIEMKPLKQIEPDFGQGFTQQQVQNQIVDMQIVEPQLEKIPKPDKTSGEQFEPEAQLIQ